MAQPATTKSFPPADHVSLSGQSRDPDRPIARFRPAAQRQYPRIISKYNVKWEEKRIVKERQRERHETERNWHRDTRWDHDSDTRMNVERGKENPNVTSHDAKIVYSPQRAFGWDGILGYEANPFSCRTLHSLPLFNILVSILFFSLPFLSLPFLSLFFLSFCKSIP